MPVWGALTRFCLKYLPKPDQENFFSSADFLGIALGVKNYFQQ